MRKLIAVLIFSSVAVSGCKRRSNREIQATKQPATSETSAASLDQLKAERNALIRQLEAQQVEGAKKIAALTLERDELNSQKASIELDIARLQKDLQASPTAEQRDDVQKRLTAATQDRDSLTTKLQMNADFIKDLLKKMDSLSEEIRSANAKISELNQRIETLEKELAIERARTETVSTTNFPKPDAGTSAANNAGAPANTPTPTPTPTTTPTTPPTTTPTPPAPPAAGVVSKIAWQFYRKNGDATLSCFEFGSTLENASLLALPCVTPVPIRQQFKTETFGSQFLIVDQRTQMCVRLEASATPASARILLGACKRGGDMDELWSFANVNPESGEFQFKSAKTGNCLHFADDKKIVQLSCAAASNILSTP